MNVEIHENNIKHFHGAIYVQDAESHISNNTLFRNSFGNIVVSGQDSLIEHNTILYAGNGTSGDGITVSDIQDTIIRQNTLFAGSCYGIAIMGYDAQNISVDGNIISDGITSGIYLTRLDESWAGNKNISVTNNIITNNLGWGLFADQADGLKIEGNQLHGNLDKSLENQLLISREVQNLSMGSNFLSYEFPDDIARKRPDFWSHVRELNTVKQ